MKRVLGVFLLLFCVCSVLAAVTVTDEVISLSSDDAVLMFSRENGSIVAFAEKGTGEPICRGSGPGLWSAELAGSRLDAAQFSADNVERRFSFEKKGDHAVDLIYECNELKVVAHISQTPGGYALSATTTPANQALKRIDLPARLSFDPRKTGRVIAPALPDDSVGLALNSGFFSEQPAECAAKWGVISSGPKAFTALYGKGIPTLDDKAPPVKLSVTEEGGKWFSPDLAARINSLSLPVVRAQPADLCDITLVASPNGAYFSGSRLKGKGGCLWRIGDGVRGEQQGGIAQSVTLSAVGKLMRNAPAGRDKVALLDLRNAPETGGWSDVPVAGWRIGLWQAVSEADRRFTFAALRTVSELAQALASNDFLCIVNPYGEYFPAGDDKALMESMAALKKFVHAGGNWFEVAGYPFYQLLRPEKYLRYEAAYPPAYADLFHLETTAGVAALYRAQPRPEGEPWQAAGRHREIFVPGRIYCGGDGDGGYIGRSFITWVRPNEEWTTPTVHLVAGLSLEKTVAAYCAANSITTLLEKKIGAETLAKLRQAPLLYLAGPCGEKQAALDALPVPSLIHFSDYLRGGFDKQYPDHLPPNKDFGTQEQFRAFVDALHARGHLFSPYTNPTWWCDDPKGPTFEREGTAPLLVTEDGKNRREQYGSNPGWTTTLWHPAVQAANRQVRRQFLEEVPVDLLFQDQCGARGFLYDFNPAAPTPYAYSEGMIAMNDEDSGFVPLATEHGWDRVANFQTMLCGMTWGIVPTQGGPSWRRCLKKAIPPHAWEIYPLAQAISHDKCLFYHHDLGQFVTDNRSLVWSLALGYHLGWRGKADFSKHEHSREWYA